MRIFILFFFAQLFTEAIGSSAVIINGEETPSLLKQYNPRICLSPNNTILTSWKDERTGLPSAYGQWLDINGHSSGSNFRLHGQHLLAINTMGTVFAINKTESSDSYYFPGSTSFYGKFHYNDGSESEQLTIDGYQHHCCGTGYLGFENYLCAQNSDFIYISHNEGRLQRRRFRNDSSLMGSYETTGDSLLFHEISLAALDSTYIVLSRQFINHGDTLYTPRLALNFYTDKDSCTGKPLELIRFESSTYFETEDNIQLSSIPIPPINRYFTSWFHRDSSLLYCYLINPVEGTIDTSYSLPIPSGSDFYLDQTHSFDSPYITGAGFTKHLLFKKYNPDGTNYRQHLIYYFDDYGNHTKTVNDSSCSFPVAGKPLIYLGNDHFYSVDQRDEDIFLDYSASSALEHSALINDDERGSNESNNVIDALDNNQVLVSWYNEAGYSARILDQASSFITEEFKVNSSTWLHFPHDLHYNISKVKTLDNSYGFCFDSYDSNWNMTRRDTLSGLLASSNLPYAIEKIDDQHLAIAVLENSAANLYLVDTDLNILKSNSIKRDATYYELSIFAGDDSSFFAAFDKFLYKLDLELNIDKSLSCIPYTPKMYFGNDEFLMVEQRENENQIPYTFGLIRNLDGNQLSPEFSINYGYLLNRYLFLGYNKFLTLYTLNNKVRGRVFTKTGEMSKDEYFIDEFKGAYQKNINATLSGNSLFYSWSDTRIENTGYDIAVKTVALSDIVSIKNSKYGQPEKFSLKQNYPNPFNPLTKIEYTLPSQAQVVLTLYNAIGQSIKTLHNGKQEAGNYSLNFNAKKLASGIYYYRLSAKAENESYHSVKKMLLIR